MDLSQITPLIITYNEEANIGRVLAKLTWAKDIVIIDSGSTDKTLELVAGHPQARVLTRKFDSFASQCNFGLTQIRTPWVLSLDADYLVGDGFEAEVDQLDENVSGYRANFCYCIYGKALRGTLYPPRVVLYQTARASYEPDGHGHRVKVSGELHWLSSIIYHDDRKPLQRWLGSQLVYAEQEAEHLLRPPASGLNFADRLRLRIFVAPPLVFLYTLLWKGLLLDGFAGWHYVFQRTLAELMLSLKILDRKLRGS
ncbi:glycosyltransferase involved in cell wall biosynthesis [Roseimicrobium gellanilyticum]|uniref:Glycosyltransferase involved in cell wall biosynthesis n=1 Tax=Roseimicrobium gellanilyticum TaxID=748857 RepID=A0A366HPB0_9BACT|nr:glycosyltransferase family 2 protein [Roseimicrobium gellanilyticum]RBP45327.1 glycosyltransferase involved in cell wall biosynthesis [Roseimicrobium gellanilyticum]